MSGLGSGARRLIEWGSEQRSVRRRRPPRLRCGPARPTPRVFYLCPDYPVPSGGIRVMYRHVDLLNAAGIEAAVLHHAFGFACSWFEHSTRVIGAPDVVLASTDVLVVPEVYGPFLDRLPRQPRLVVFNQNAYLTWQHVPAGRRPRYEIFEAALTISEDSAAILRFAFPDLPVSIAPNAIDPALFHPGEATVGQRIATMPRKRPEDLALIERLLEGRMSGWELVRIEGASEAQTAAAMRAAPIFLSLGRREGFGLPAAEAMASGGFVVGFPGFGGREIFDPTCSAPIEDGDIGAAAMALDASMRRFEADPAGLRADGARAAALVRERYTPAAQADAVLAFFAGLGLPV